jgi:DNA replication licensing factor MCM5
VYKTHYQSADEFEDTPLFQVQVHSDEHPRMLRDLQSNFIGQLIVVPGIITNASRTSIRASKVVVQCRNCGHQKQLTVSSGFGGISIPRVCDNQRNPGVDKQQCKIDTYTVVTDRCEYIDQQSLKL